MQLEADVASLDQEAIRAQILEYLREKYPTAEGIEFDLLPGSVVVRVRLVVVAEDQLVVDLQLDEDSHTAADEAAQRGLVRVLRLGPLLLCRLQLVLVELGALSAVLRRILPCASRVSAARRGRRRRRLARRRRGTFFCSCSSKLRTAALYSSSARS